MKQNKEVTPNSRKLIQCPYCEEEGKKKIVGEMKEKGFEVLRFNHSITRIISSDFSVECGECGSTIFFHNENI